jgi:hypothetical protein
MPSHLLGWSFGAGAGLVWGLLCSLDSHCWSPRGGGAGGGLWVGLSSGQWTRASFFPGRRDSSFRGGFGLRGGSVVVDLSLLDDCVVLMCRRLPCWCVVVVGVLVKLSRAHGGCLGIRSR